jgi:hypothetical protein
MFTKRPFFVAKHGTTTTALGHRARATPTPTPTARWRYRLQRHLNLLRMPPPNRAGRRLWQAHPLHILRHAAPRSGSFARRSALPRRPELRCCSAPRSACFACCSTLPRRPGLSVLRMLLDAVASSQAPLPQRPRSPHSECFACRSTLPLSPRPRGCSLPVLFYRRSQITRDSPKSGKKAPSPFTSRYFARKRDENACPVLPGSIQTQALAVSLGSALTEAPSKFR